MKKQILKNLLSYSRILLLVLFLSNCATYKEQYHKDLATKIQEATPVHSYYIAGGLGNSKHGTDRLALNLLKEQLQQASGPSSLIFTGDNITASIDSDNKDKQLLDKQLEIANAFKGKTYFLHGNNEWKSKDTETIHKIDAYIDDRMSEKETDKCPLEQIEINEQLDLIIVNSAWFLSNWNGIKNINKSCTEIVTEREFLEELQNYINDAQGKNVLIAMHHPIFSNGKFSGEYTFGSQIVPLPVFGSVISGFESLGGFSSNYLASKKYSAFRVIISFLAQESSRITIISGHEESLQYLVGQNGTHQIISGSLGSKKATKRSKNSITTTGGSLKYEGKFTNAKNGFAKLDYYADGSSAVTFYTTESNTPPKTIEVHLPFKKDKKNVTYKLPDGETVAHAIASGDKLSKSGFYKALWGDRYREYFSKKVVAPIALLDTLYGGLKVIKKGGGHQSYTLRLQDKKGREYAMRSLDKNALRILKFNVFGSAYTIDEFKDTAAEKLVYDFFTTSHPYMLLPISPLAAAANVNHANAKMYYVPKQERLGQYNDVYGNAFYFIEERPSKGWKDNETYNRSAPDRSSEIRDFKTTEKMLSKLQEDESYTVDERAFIRARLFDMLIGDWDRHADQYRWAEYKFDHHEKRFVVIPRDRDNAFPKFDGLGLSFIKWFNPLIRSWQTYTPKIRNLKWLNDKGNILDKALLTNSDANIWVEEAKIMQANISNADIESAFSILPQELRDDTAASIQKNLTQRLADLHKYAEAYGKSLNKLVILHATDKDDIIEIERLPEGKTIVVLKRNLENSNNPVYYKRTFDKVHTKEIYIYGLGDNDTFIVKGNGKREIMIRLVGGYGEDSFTVSNKSALKVYDYTYEKINFNLKTPRKQLTNQYNTNLFHWRNIRENHNTFLPNIGFRSDDGFLLGGISTYTKYGLNGNPFRQKHSFAANYYFSFSSIQLQYNGIFANIFPGVDLELGGRYNSNGFVQNFFGFGNETTNFEDDLGIDFNRARTQQIKLNAGLGFNAFKIFLYYQQIDVEEQADRFFTPQNIDSRAFESQNYVGGEVSLLYKNNDAEDFPTRAFSIAVDAGYKVNTDLGKVSFGYASAQLSLARKIISSGNLVFSTTLEGKSNFGDNFFFYDAPSIGGQNGLRGFRDERFAGRTYFYQSSDLRLRLKKYSTSAIPITIGLFGGFDYGRVWTIEDRSNVWHTSQGGGIWLSGLNNFGLNFGYFNSKEDNIIQIGFGFGF